MGFHLGSSGDMGIASLLIAIIALGLAVVGIATPAVSTFTQAVADTLYCSITSANCSGLYCTFGGGTGSGSNCFSTPIIDCQDYNSAKKTTAQSITSTSFTTYTSSATWSSWQTHTAGLACSGPQGFALGILFCTASFYFTVNSTSVIASFQLNDISTGGGTGTSATFQAQPSTANQAEIGSIAWQAQSTNVQAPPNIALQGKVSGSNMLLSIKTGAFWCLAEGSDSAAGSGTVG